MTPSEERMALTGRSGVELSVNTKTLEQRAWRLRQSGRVEVPTTVFSTCHLLAGVIKKQVPFSLALALAYCHACLYNNRRLQQSFISKHLGSCLYFGPCPRSSWAARLAEPSEGTDGRGDAHVENDLCTEQIQENRPFFANPSLIERWISGCVCFQSLLSCFAALCWRRRDQRLTEQTRLQLVRRPEKPLSICQECSGVSL